MITPEKHLNLELSIIRIAAMLLKKLKRLKIMKMDEIAESAKKIAGEDAYIILPGVLSFLYLLGKVEYHEQTDCIELFQNQEQG